MGSARIRGGGGGITAMSVQVGQPGVCGLGWAGRREDAGGGEGGVEWGP